MKRCKPILSSPNLHRASLSPIITHHHTFPNIPRTNLFRYGGILLGRDFQHRNVHNGIIAQEAPRTLMSRSDSFISESFKEVHPEFFYEMIHRFRFDAIADPQLKQEALRDEQAFMDRYVASIDMNDLLTHMERVLGADTADNKEIFKFLYAMKSIMDDELMTINFELCYTSFLGTVLLTSLSQKSIMYPISLPYKLRIDDIVDWKVIHELTRHLMTSEEHSERFRKIVNDFIFLPTTGLACYDTFRDDPELMTRHFERINDVLLESDETVLEQRREEFSHRIEQDEEKLKNGAPDMRDKFAVTDIPEQSNIINRESEYNTLEDYQFLKKHPLRSSIYNQLRDLYLESVDEKQFLQRAAELYAQSVIQVIEEFKREQIMDEVKREHVDEQSEFIPDDFEINITLDEKDLKVHPQDYYTFMLDSRFFLAQLKRTNPKEYERLTAGFEAFARQTAVLIKERSRYDWRNIQWSNTMIITTGIMMGVLAFIVLWWFALPQLAQWYWGADLRREEERRQKTSRQSGNDMRI